MTIASQRGSSSTADDDSKTLDQVEEEVFKQVYIPRTLDEVRDYEKDMDVAKHTGDDSHVSSMLKDATATNSSHCLSIAILGQFSLAFFSPYTRILL